MKETRRLRLRLMLKQIRGRIGQSCINITLKTVKRVSLIRMVSPTWIFYFKRQNLEFLENSNSTIAILLVTYFYARVSKEMFVI